MTSVPAYAGRAAARAWLAAMIFVALPTVALTPLVVMRMEIAARRAAAKAAAFPAVTSQLGYRVATEEAPSCVPGEAGGATLAAPAAMALPAWRQFVRRLIETVPLWMPLGLTLLVAAPWWLRRTFARRRAYLAPPDDPERFWSAQRRIRPLNREPAFAWLPASARAVFTWDVVPQAAFSTFAFGLVAGRMGFELTLALVACVQGTAFLLFLFEHGVVRRSFGLALARLAATRQARRARSVAEVAGSAPGSLFRIRGRVRSHRRVRGLISGEHGAYRLAWFVARTPRRLPDGEIRVIEYTLADETGHDFDLVDGEGRTLRVEIGHAQWLARTPRARRLPPDVLATLPPGPFAPDARVHGSEVLLRDGDRVEVIGYLDSIVDPTDEHMPRQTPVRLVLRGGSDRPLLIRSA